MRVRYRPVMVEKMNKNESILIPNDSDMDISLFKAQETEIDKISNGRNSDKLTTIQSYSSGTSDTNESETKPTRYTYCSPVRLSYKDRFMLEKKLDFFIQSAKKITNEQKQYKNSRC